MDRLTDDNVRHAELAAEWFNTPTAVRGTQRRATTTEGVASRRVWETVTVASSGPLPLDRGSEYPRREHSVCEGKAVFERQVIQAALSCWNSSPSLMYRRTISADLWRVWRMMS